MTAAVRLLLRHRRILWSTTLTDIRGRYAGTALGIVWAICYPLLFLGLYAVLYVMVFRIKPGELGTGDYVLMVFAGLIPFLGFAEALGLGVNSVVANRGLVKNTLFPIDLVPVKAVLVGSLTMVIGFMLLQSVTWAHGNVHLSQLATPFILCLQLVFTIGVIWLLSALQVFLKDLGQAVSLGVLFLMLASPIAYTMDMIPERLVPLLYLNPLTHLITLYRECILAGHVSLWGLAAFAAIALAAFCLGHYVFARLKGLFPEYV